MKADVSDEQRFMAEAGMLQFGEQDGADVLHALDAWLAELTSNLHAGRLAPMGLHEGSALAVQANALNAILSRHAAALAQPWSSLQAARELADIFENKALLLVFGKFNAGKSSFCNFLADRFIAQGKPVDYFHIDAGRIARTSARFEEGATETTSRLQGVRLGEQLVLLDTPGLHSVTPENTALTQRFIESADGVLWLTSSTSPGQVQELDDLGLELHRSKPLLPIVTRSDEYEEDEVDGEIVKVLRNKSGPRRAQQEADVHARAQEKLAAMGVDVALLKRPVSVSVHMAREACETPAAMSESGLEGFYAALQAIIGPSLAYRRRKRAEMALHHLEDTVLGPLCADVFSVLSALSEATRAAHDRLERQQQALSEAVARQVLPTLPELLDTHAVAGDVQAVCNVVSKAIETAFLRATLAELGDYPIATDASASTRIALDDEAGFENIVVERAGANGLEREVVGVDYERLHAALKIAIRERGSKLSRNAIEQVRATLAQLAQQIAQLDDSLSCRAQDLRDLKRMLRARSA